MFLLIWKNKKKLFSNSTFGFSPYVNSGILEVSYSYLEDIDITQFSFSRERLCLKVLFFALFPSTVCLASHVRLAFASALQWE